MLDPKFSQLTKQFSVEMAGFCNFAAMAVSLRTSIRLCMRRSVYWCSLMRFSISFSRLSRAVLGISLASHMEVLQMAGHELVFPVESAVE
jgi:hypothetical protein